MSSARLAEYDADYRAAWRQPERMTPRQWAERFRVLSRRQSSRPGRWSTEAAPALAGLMDLCGMPQVRRLNVMKSAQVGASEALRNVIAYMAEREPDPVLLNLPDETRGRRIFGDRILPLFEDTDRLKALTTDAGRDQTLTHVLLSNGFTLRLAWSGSASSLASDPIRLVINDEVDKFAAWAGAEADPISLAEARTITYANSLVVNSSTPTTRHGMIFRLYEASPVKLAFHVPCPHCGHVQTLRFDRLKWEKRDDVEDRAQRAALLLQAGAAWYECERCPARIVEHHRAPMLMAGYWGDAADTFRLYVDGRTVRRLPDEAEVGIHLSCLHSLAARQSFAGIAAEFVRSAGDPMRMQNFKNAWLGEVFEERVAATRSEGIRAKVPLAPPPFVVPAWATAIVATADTQLDHFWFTIRAWGFDYRSTLLHYGIVTTFDELYRVAFDTTFRNEAGADMPATASSLLIDSGGNRTDEVYQFAMNDPGRIWPTKGAAGRMQRPWTPTRLASGVTLRMVDVGYFKDMLHRLIHHADPTRWLPHREVDEDYCRQLASEHKVLDRKSGSEVWRTVTSGAANHLWDCEVLQCAAADMGNFGLVDNAPDEPADAAPAARPYGDPMSRPQSWITSYKGRH